jgi:hypothetical protein
MPTFNSGMAPDIFDTRPLWLSFLAFRQNPESFRELATVKKADAGHIDLARFSGLGRFQTKQEGVPVSYDIPVQGARMRITHSTYGLGTAMTKEAVDDARFDVLDRQTEALSRSALDHRERLFWDLLNDAFAAATHVTIDGLAICSTAHTMLKPPTAGQTLSNRIAPFVPLSTEGLETAIITLKTQLSEEGHQIGQGLPPRKLVVPTELIHVANNVLDAKGRPGTTNTYDINTISRFGITAVDSPYLTEEQTWWLMSDKEKNGLVWNDRQSYTISNNTDADTGDRKWRATYRASVMCKEWQGIVGTTP